MTNTPSVFEFSSNDPVLSKLTSHLNKNPGKKKRYIIEEAGLGVTFLYIDNEEETNYFLLYIYLPTRGFSDKNAPEEIEHIIFRHIPCFDEQRILLERLIEQDATKKDLLKLKEDEDSYTSMIPASVAPEQYLRRLFLVEEMDRIRMANKKIKDKKQAKSNNLYNSR